MGQAGTTDKSLLQPPTVLPPMCSHACGPPWITAGPLHLTALHEALISKTQLPICLQWSLRSPHTLALTKGFMVMMVAVTRTVAQQATSWAAVASLKFAAGRHGLKLKSAHPSNSANGAQLWGPPHHLPSSCYPGRFIPH